MCDIGYVRLVTFPVNITYAISSSLYYSVSGGTILIVKHCASDNSS